jgi:acyl-CoA synthetase (AMP-forming)/AMP-acid ligase II
LSLQATTLADVLPSGSEHGRAVVIPDIGVELTYAQLRDRIESVAQALRRGGVGPGDRVAIVLPNGLEFLVTFLAVTWAGATAAPLNPAFTLDEYRFYIADARAGAAILSPGAQAAREAAAALGVPMSEAQFAAGAHVNVEPLVGKRPSRGTVETPRPDDVALLLHTSGTTSRPKGVPLTHRNLMSSIQTIQSSYGLTPADVSLVVMPLFHVHGLLGATLSALHGGGTVVIPPRFSAGSFCGDITKYGVTWYSAVPTIHRSVLLRAAEEKLPAGKLRFIRSCSAALTPEVWGQLEDRFAAPVVQAYGMTEAAHQIASNPLPPAARKRGTVGVATGMAITIRDEKGAALPTGARGEVAIAGDSVTPGYDNNPEATAAAFIGPWLRTGDEGWIDADGFLTLAGRIKEMINRGGEKISPPEVDAVLSAHPAVAEAVCFGVPDEKYGEEIHAAVVLKAAVSDQELMAFCSDRVARFKVPKRIYVVSDLPRTATGKPQRQQVALRCRDQPHGGESGSL